MQTTRDVEERDEQSVIITSNINVIPDWLENANKVRI